jgi:hypothetical protein
MIVGNYDGLSNAMDQKFICILILTNLLALDGGDVASLSFDRVLTCVVSFHF